MRVGPALGGFRRTLGWDLRTGLGVGAAPMLLMTFQPASLEDLLLCGAWTSGLHVPGVGVWVPGWERDAHALGTQ